MKVKKNVIATTVAIASMFVVALALDVQAQEECSVATLQGDYLLTGGAQARIDQSDDPTFPRVFVGVHTFNGAGNMSGFNTQSQGGVIRQRVPVEATYTLDADCTGTLTFPAQTWDIVVTRDGREGAYIRVDDGTIATRYIKKR